MHRFLHACLLAFAASMLTACGLAPQTQRPSSFALAVAEAVQTPLGIATLAMRHKAQAAEAESGIHSLYDAQDAFAARALLARMATRTLDVQYYIWRSDKTGDLLLHELLTAADRGVRVRLLLDDNGIAGMDDKLAALHTHPQVQVRLFNPFSLRAFKPLGFLTDFNRANRRMHNKGFTADNQASILGGRNVGNEYFGATDGILFSDLDVLVTGPVVGDISADFDRYWSSASAHTMDSVTSTSLTLAALRSQGEQLLASPAAQDYRGALTRTPFIQHLTQGELPMHWAKAQLVSDDPAKGLGTAQDADLIGMQMSRAIGKPQRSVDLVSPYFVPTATGVASFLQMRQQGIRVRILTNAFEATDVALVHSGYAKHRQALLQGGIELYEMRRSAPNYADEKEALLMRMTQRGSSGSSLHAKTFAADGQRAFVGSFNFDPRSMALNTEMGLVIESPAMAQEIGRAFDQRIPTTAYRVSLGERGQLQWHSGVGNPPPVYNTEPNTTALQRVSLWFFGLLPIDWLL